MTASTIANPFARLAPAVQRRVLVGLVIAFVGLSIGLSVLGMPLINDAAPWGIVSFELAGTATRAAEILASWGETGRTLAAVNLGLDFLYLLVYPALLSLACLRIAARIGDVRPRRAALGRNLATAVLAAAPLDGIENFALWRLLVDGPAGTWAGLAWVSATLKFTLVIAAGLYVLTGLAGPQPARR